MVCVCLHVYINAYSHEPLCLCKEYHYWEYVCNYVYDTCIYRLRMHVYLYAYIYVRIYIYLYSHVLLHADISTHMYNTNIYTYIYVSSCSLFLAFSLSCALSLCPSLSLHYSVSPALSLSNPLSLPPSLPLSPSPLSLFLLPAFPLSQTHFLFLSLSSSLAVARTLSRTHTLCVRFLSSVDKKEEVTNCFLDLRGKVWGGYD